MHYEAQHLIAWLGSITLHRTLYIICLKIPYIGGLLVNIQGKLTRFSVWKKKKVVFWSSCQPLLQGLRLEEPLCAVLIITEPAGIDGSAFSSSGQARFRKKRESIQSLKCIWTESICLCVCVIWYETLGLSKFTRPYGCILLIMLQIVDVSYLSSVEGYPKVSELLCVKASRGGVSGHLDFQENLPFPHFSSLCMGMTPSAVEVSGTWH